MSSKNNKLIGIELDQVIFDDPICKPFNWEDLHYKKGVLLHGVDKCSPLNQDKSVEVLCFKADDGKLYVLDTKEVTNAESYSRVK